MRRIWLFMAAWSLLGFSGEAQRVYKSTSSLASGNWYKIAVSAPGIYKVDLSLLRSLGVNTQGLSSSSIRLFGNGGALLPEPCNGARTDDLIENAIEMVDGGDGNFGEGDYFLFYAPGPHHWAKDTVNRRFTHIKNIYTEQAYYFINIGGGVGRRVALQGAMPAANTSISTYTWRAFHELDTINILSSGKDWYGEEFSNIPGGTATRSFIITPSGWDRSVPVYVSTDAMARSIGASSHFALTVGGVSAGGGFDIGAVTSGSYDVFGRVVNFQQAVAAGQGPLTLSYQFTPGGYNAQGWLDWWELSGRGALSLAGVAQLQFRDWNSVGSGHIGAFALQGANAQTQVWDVTDPAGPLNMAGNLSGGTFGFTGDCGSLHEYIAFDAGAKALPVAPGSGKGEGYPYGGANGDPNGADLGATGLFTPLLIGKVANQNLHQPVIADLLIITDEALLGQAQRLAQFHTQHDRLRTLVVTSSQVYNEFAGGNPDPTALRDYVKMFYDRSGGDSTKRPRYLLLFGSGSFDYKDRIQGNVDAVPVYESGVSIDPLNTYTSDDFFGMLKDGSDVNVLDGRSLLDIGVGRIPARTVAEAGAVVDKIIHYADIKTQGPWRNEVTLVADDGDQNLHLQDAETFAGTITTSAPVFGVDKIYLDAYKQQSTPAGGRYPDVNQAISGGLYSGTLLWNYTGHGSNARLSNSDILDASTVAAYNNPDKLPLFITATCDFAPHDNPLIQSIGASLLTRPGSGAIALMTTTRLVFAFSNKTINNNYYQLALTPRADGTYYSLGDACRLTKNFTYTTQTDAVNNRKFTLLGDPALTLALPVYKVKTTAINGRVVGGGGGVADTLKALNQVSVSGVVTDGSGAVMNSFNGVLYATVYDKPRMATTLGNGPGSYRTEFAVQNNVLYKGKVPVSQGNFSFAFVVPRDINYQYGRGRISYYASATGAGSGIGTDGNGVFTDVIIGGSGGGTGYTGGPAITAFLNDEKFVDGGITNANPILLLHLSDSLGINITGTGIGHDITAVLDNNTQEPLVLNSFYEADLNTFKKGTVRYPLPQMTEGEHTLLIKAWNVANNSGQTSITFRVVGSKKLVLTHVLNYPNPFSTHTTFWFEHNRPGEDLSVLVQILTVSGKLVKSFRRTINTPGNRSSDIDWDGRDDYGSKIGRGVYIYRVRVRATDGSTADVFQKLYIL